VTDAGWGRCGSEARAAGPCAIETGAEATVFLGRGPVVWRADARLAVCGPGVAAVDGSDSAAVPVGDCGRSGDVVSPVGGDDTGSTCSVAGCSGLDCSGLGSPVDGRSVPPPLAAAEVAAVASATGSVAWTGSVGVA
jgi:hypothetical protein